MTAGRWILVLWIAWSIFGTLVFFVFRTSPRVNALQTAGTVTRAKDVLRHWRSSGQFPTARRNMTFDYGFVATFYPCMALASWVFGRRLGWMTAATIFAVVAIVAGLSDLVEDLALESIVQLPTPGATRLAALCASVKFTLAPVALLFVLIAGGLLLFRQDGV